MTKGDGRRSLGFHLSLGSTDTGLVEPSDECLTSLLLRKAY